MTRDSKRGRQVLILSALTTTPLSHNNGALVSEAVVYNTQM